MDNIFLRKLNNLKSKNLQNPKVMASTSWKSRTFSYMNGSNELSGQHSDMTAEHIIPSRQETHSLKPLQVIRSLFDPNHNLVLKNPDCLVPSQIRSGRVDWNRTALRWGSWAHSSGMNRYKWSTLVRRLGILHILYLAFYCIVLCFYVPVIFRCIG